MHEDAIERNTSMEGFQYQKIEEDLLLFELLIHMTDWQQLSAAVG